MFKSIRMIACAAGAIAFMGLGSCSGGSEKGLFGNLTSEYAEMMTERDELKKEAENIKTEAEKAEFIEKGKKLDEKWSEKLEESAKELDGKQLEVTDSLFKVTTPLTLEFEKLLGSNLEPNFKVDGAAETTHEITKENTYLGTLIVYLAGYDKDGKELFTSEIGKVEGKLTDDKLVVPAGAPVKFTSLRFNDKYVKEYPETTSMMLITK